jgi:hypothetical protein
MTPRFHPETLGNATETAAEERTTDLAAMFQERRKGRFGLAMRR